MNLGVATTATATPFGITPRELTCPARTLGVGGIMDIGVQELFVLFVAFSVPMAVAAWVLRR